MDDIAERKILTDDEKESNSKIAKILGCTANDVAQLCELFQKSAEELPDAMAGLNWGAEKLAKVTEALVPDFVAIKFELHPRDKEGICAVLLLIFDNKAGRITDEMFWVMHGSIPEDFLVTDKWERFRERINQIPGKVEKVALEKFRVIIRSILSREMLRNIARNDSPELRQKIELDITTAAQSFSTRRPDCSLDIEHFSEARLELGGIKAIRENPDGSPLPEEEEEFSLMCMPVIDPVHGTSAGDLQEGERILVELMDGPGMAGVVYNLLTKSKIEPLFPIISKDMQDSGLLVIRFAINDEIAGTVRVSPDIRLKTDKQSVKKPGASGGGTPIKEKLLVAAMVVIAMGLVLFIVSMLIG